jgi:hypothetical protein
LRKNEKEQLAGILLNYCDSFYADDPSGNTIYGIDIKAIKDKEATYKEILYSKNHPSEPYVVPLKYDDPHR